MVSGLGLLKYISGKEDGFSFILLNINAKVSSKSFYVHLFYAQWNTFNNVCKHQEDAQMELFPIKLLRNT